MEHQPRADMWFVDVRPSNPSAASISVGVFGDEFLVSVPNARWELWSDKEGRPPLAVLERHLDAIFAGRIEIAGGAVRLELSGGETPRMGNASLPIPWRWRRRTSFLPYSAVS